MKLDICRPSMGLAESIFWNKLDHTDWKFALNVLHFHKKWLTPSKPSLQIKQRAPGVPCSHGTPVFSPKFRISLKLQLHDAIYRLRFYSNSLIHILSHSNSHNNVASIQKNRGDKSHRVIVALSYNYTMRFIGYDSIQHRWFISYRFEIHTIT